MREHRAGIPADAGAGLRGRQVCGERNLGPLEPARELTDSARHELEERALRAVFAQLSQTLIQSPGHLVELVPGLIDDRGGAREERQGSGDDGRRARSVPFLLHGSMVAPPHFLGKPRRAGPC